MEANLKGKRLRNNFFFFPQNGHSVEELAVYTGNKEIVELIRRSRMVVKQEEQFIDLLSVYLQKKDSENVAKKEVYIHVHTCMCMCTCTCTVGSLLCMYVLSLQLL